MPDQLKLPDSIPFPETDDLPPLLPGFIDVAEDMLREEEGQEAFGGFSVEFDKVSILTEIPEWVKGELRERLQAELDKTRR